MKRFVQALLALGLVWCSSTANAAQAATVSNAYHADIKIPPGALVSLKSGSTTDVELASQDNTARLLGVAIPSTSSDAPMDVSIVESGLVQVLVSDQNGKVEAGDQIATSALAGVGTKAAGATRVIGVAQSAATATSFTATIKTTSGSSKLVHVGYVTVVVAPYNYNGTGSGGSSWIPQAAQRIADSLSGTSTPAWKVTAGMLILLVAVMFAGIQMYSGVRSGLISVGRNPLSERAIFKDLLVVMTTSVITLLLALGITYLIFRL